MKKIITTLILLAITGSANIAAASETITPEPNIFDNLSVIDITKIHDIIKESLAGEDIDGEIEITTRGYEKGLQINSKHDSFTVDVANFSVNKMNRRFKSTLSFKSEGYAENIDIDGEYEEIVKIPVFKSKISYNTPITKNDVVFMSIPRKKLKNDTVTDEQELIGQTLKRSMISMRPIRKRDIVKQQIVFRNATVNVVYKTPFMTLSTYGIAMENGGKDDIINIRNVESNKIFQAKIENANLVTITPENAKL